MAAPIPTTAKKTRETAVKKLGSQTTSSGKKSTATDGASGNPPFDPRMLDMFNPEGQNKPFFRGYIVQQAGSGTNGGKDNRYRCNFLYNPESFAIEYKSNLSTYSPIDQAPQNNGVANLQPDMQTLNFALLFDRTYEVWRVGQNKTTAGPAGDRQGVYADVQALEKCCGIENGFGGLYQIPLTVNFGQTDYVRITGGNALRFDGYVTSMSVTYTHFSYNMTPMRAAVSLSFSQADAKSLAGLQTQNGDFNSAVVDQSAGTQVRQ